MRFVLAVLVVVCSCSRERVAGPEIATVNAVVGDASFVAAYGRAPTAADDPHERIRTHLAFAEAQLRASEPHGLTAAQRAARSRALDHLRAYWQRGEFPASDGTAGWLPTFVDDRGVRCAVAFLVDRDAGSAPVVAINERYRNAYIAQIDAPALVAWAEQAGFSRQELALIQPAYPPRDPDVRLSLAAEYVHATSEANGGLSHGGGLQGHVRWGASQENPAGLPFAGLSGGLGVLGGDRAHLTYDAHFFVGTHLPARMDRYRVDPGVSVGVGIDGITDHSAMALTMPLDVYLYFGRDRTRVGVLGGPRFAPGDRTLGWRVAAAFIRRSVTYAKKRDYRIELGAERIDDAVMFGVRLGISTRTLDEWWDRG